MSVRVMAKIWDCGPDRQSDRFLLLALADFANDAGECWPGMKSVAQKCCMTERGAQKIIRRLEDDGWLSIDTGGGRHGCNRYVINTERRSGFSSETPNEVHPEHRSPPPNVDAETPNVDAENPEHRSPEPSRTIKEPPKDGHSFDDFWAAWPNKVKKADAQKAFKRLSLGNRFLAAQSAAAWYAAWRKKNPDANPIHPTSYLNQKRWEDEGWKPQAVSGEIKDRAAYYAQKIKAGERVGRFTVSVNLAEEIVGRGLATKEEVRKSGLSI